jgi:hypothetical protein
VVPPLEQDPERERHKPERDERQHPDDDAAADRAEADAPRDARRPPDEHDQRRNRHDGAGEPDEVDEALVPVRAAQLGIREVPVHVEPTEVEVRHARPEQEPRHDDPRRRDHG